MNNNKNEEFNELYKKLKVWDEAILNEFDNKDISDNDYFNLGIKNEIISNALNILINYFSGNIESAGIDNSCRTIIEALVIEEMNARGDISDLQKRIYRYLYACVDWDNYKYFLKDIKIEHPNIERLKADKEKAINAMMQHFNCEQRDLEKGRIDIDDPCFFLQKKLKHSVRFSYLLNKYPLEFEQKSRAYSFFSIFIHPRCELDMEVKDRYLEFRDGKIVTILKAVEDYLNDKGMLLGKEELTNIGDFDHDLFDNPTLSNNIWNIQKIWEAFDYLIKQLCFFENGFDAFSIDFFNQISSLIIDMMISVSLGYKEHAISNFKSFLESYSAFYSINMVKNVEEFKSIKKAYWVSSRIQLDEYFESINDASLNSRTIYGDEIKKLYDGFYKTRYKLNDFNEFCENLKKNSLYALSNEKKSYNRLVTDFVSAMFIDDDKRKDLISVYKTAKDIAHASGYGFNASKGVVDFNSHKALFYAWKILLQYLLLADITYSENGKNVDLKPVIKLFQELGNEEVRKLKELKTKYSDEDERESK